MSRKKIDPRFIKKVLVIRLDALGDGILTTPLISTIRKNWPESVIDVLCTPYTRPLFSRCPGVNQAIPFRGGTMIENYSFFRKIGQNFYDLVLTASPTQNSYLATRLAKAPHRVGVIYRERPLVALAQSLYNIFTDPVYTSPRKSADEGRPIPHEVKQVLSLCGPLGITDLDQKLYLIPDTDEKEQAVKLFKKWKIDGKPVFCVHLSHKWVRARWEESHVNRLIDSLEKSVNGSAVLAIYGPAEKDLGRRMRETFKNRPGIRCEGGMSIGTWAAVMAKCQVAVTPDTSAIHVAAAMKVPVAAVYSVDDFELNSQKFAPWQVPNLVIRRSDPVADINDITKWAASTVSHPD